MLNGLASLLALQAMLGGLQPGARPRLPSVPVQWVSDTLRAGETVFYVTGPDGLYLYRRRPMFQLVGYLYVDNAPLFGPVLDAAQDVFVIDWSSSPEASVVDEYKRTGRRFLLVRQFNQAQYGYALAVGPRGDVFVAANGGEVLGYRPQGGAPTRAFGGGFVFQASGVAVDAKDDLFVASQPNESGILSDGSRPHCYRRSLGHIVEYLAPSRERACIYASGRIDIPGSMAFDAIGNLAVSDLVDGGIDVLSPPDWTITGRFPAHSTAWSLSFALPSRLYYLDSPNNTFSTEVVERTYPAGNLVGTWPAPVPQIGGIAVGHW